MGQNNEVLMQKALSYNIVLDMVRAVLSNIGSVNTSDGSKVASIVYDEVTNAAVQQAK